MSTPRSGPRCRPPGRCRRRRWGAETPSSQAVPGGRGCVWRAGGRSQVAYAETAGRASRDPRPAIIAAPPPRGSGNALVVTGTAGRGPRRPPLARGPFITRMTAPSTSRVSTSCSRNRLAFALRVVEPSGGCMTADWPVRCGLATSGDRRRGSRLLDQPTAATQRLSLTRTRRTTTSSPSGRRPSEHTTLAPRTSAIGPICSEEACP